MSGIRKCPPRPPTPPAPKEPVQTVLIGMIFDLSWTMRDTCKERDKNETDKRGMRAETTNKDSIPEESWAASFLGLIQDLVRKNEVAHIETFAFGAGGQVKLLPSEFRRDSIVSVEVNQTGTAGGDARQTRRDSTAPGVASQSRRDSAVPGVASQSRRDSTAPGVASQSRRDSTAPGVASQSRRDSTAPGVASQSRLDSTAPGVASQSRRDSTANESRRDSTTRIGSVVPLHDNASGGAQNGNVTGGGGEGASGNSTANNSELTPAVFDILRTVEDFGKGDDVIERVKKKRDNLKYRPDERVVDDIMSLLERNGAHSIREWASPKQVSEILDENDHISASLLAGLEEDPQFLRAVVNTCLPKPCLKSTSWDINHPGRFLWEIFFGALHAGVMVGDPTRIDMEIRKARVEARNIWLKMHPGPGTRAVVTEEAVFEGQRAIDILRGPSPRAAKNREVSDARIKQILAQATPYIFGGTPLIEALDEAVKVFKTSKADKKILFVVSDGVPTDIIDDEDDTIIREALRAREALSAMQVHVVSCYIDMAFRNAGAPHDDSSVKDKKPVGGKTLYCKLDEKWVIGARFMYNLSSAISTQHIPKTVFIQRDWKVQIDEKTNETRLFAQVNHPKLLDEMVNLVRELACSQDALCDLLGFVSLDLFINTVNDSFTAPDQGVGPTCYANAVGAVIYMAMKRIYKREADPLPKGKTEEEEILKPSEESEIPKPPEEEQKWSLFKDHHIQKQKEDERLRLEENYKSGYPYFEETEAESQRENFLRLRKELIIEYGPKKGGRKTRDVLKGICPRFRLQYKNVELMAAMEAVSNQQPVVATFRLTVEGWKNFKAFFRREPTHVLRFSDIGEQNGEKLGHAVVFTSYSSKGLTFMNSWGTGFGNNGFFTLEHSRVVPRLKFYTVFWELNNLKDVEKRAYKKSGSEVLEKLTDKYCGLNRAVHVCDECGKPSKVVDYEGYYAEAKCPKCKKSFSTSGYSNLALALYVKGGQQVIDDHDGDGGV